jgi:tetratricopeptide (TPR) repeat protein
MPETHDHRPAERANYVWLFVALALTFFIRLWFVLSMRGQPFSTIGPQMLDAYYYHRWATDIMHGSFWGTDVFFLRPFYPYVLALIYTLFGQHILAVQLVQIALATVSCYLLYDTTRRMFGARPATFASIGFALSGVLVFYTGTLLYVEITVLLSLLFLWLVLIAGRRLWLWVLAGVCFGSLVICRPEMLVAAPFLLWWLLRRRDESALTPSLSREGRGGRAGVVLMAASAILVIAVVPVRNYIVARDPVLFTAHSGMNFYYGNDPSADGTWQPTQEFEKGGGFSHERLAETSRTIDGKQVKSSQASAYWTAQGLKFMTRQPGAYLKLLGRKLLLFLSDYEVPNDYYPETARAASLPLRLAFVNFGFALALGLLGMAWAWPKRGQVLPAYLYVGAYLVSALLFYVLSRLRAPVIPFLLMFAGYAVNELVGALKQRRFARVSSGVGLAVAVYIVSAIIPINRSSYSAQAWTQQGNIYLEREDFGRAVGAFRRALAALPSYSYARYSLVLALAGDGETSDAETEVRRIEQATAASNDHKTLLSLAVARIAVANSISTASPAWRPARRLADAWVAISDGKYARAESLYLVSVAQDSSDSESRFLLGMVYVRMDSLAQAREWLTRAAALDPANSAARNALKLVNARLQGAPGSAP